MKTLLTITFALFSITLFSQSVGIGTGTPNSSAMLEIVSNTKGILVPRMSSTDRSNITTPATGLLVFDTDYGDFWFYNGSVWVEITTAAAGTNYWTLASNNISSNNPGNVGVGIAGSSISEKFQVDANMKVGNAVWSLGNDRVIKFGDGTFVTIGEAGQDDRMVLTGRNFIFTPSSTYTGYIGINTTAPSSPLSFGNIIGEKINFWNTDATHNYGIGVQGGLLQIHANDATADIAFGTGISSSGASFNELMRIKGNGNVGINFVNPLEKLAVASLFNAFGISHTAIDGSLKLATYIGSPTAGSDGAWIGTTTNHPLYFFTANANPGNTTPAMSITNSGTVGIGTGNPTLAAGRKMEIKGLSNTYARITTTSSNNSAVGIEFCYTGSANAVQDWRIRTSATAGETNLYLESSSDHFVNNHPSQYEFWSSFFTPGDDNVKSLGLPFDRWTTVYATNGVINTSDRREKQNIQQLNYGIREVMQLKPVSFQWIKNPGQGIQLGFIAQDVEQVISEAVVKPVMSRDKKSEGLYGLNYAELIPVLTKAIQEQETQIELLMQQNKLIMNEIKELKKQ